MNQIKSLAIAVLAVFAFSTATAQGVNFFKGTFAEGVAKAKEENKLIFIDFYTTWCGPCKKMDKEIFPKAIVGDYFNQHFVSLKIDAEKGEGITLANKYEVKGYPTLLVLNADETEKNRLVGATPDAAFLVNFAKQVMGEIQDFQSVFKEYEAGNRNLGFIQKVLSEGPVFASTLKEREEQVEWFKKFGEISSWYFKAKRPDELLNAKDFKLISMFLDGPNNRHPVVEFVYNHYEDYKKIVPVDELTMFILRTNNQSIHEASGAGDLSFREYVEAINGRLKQAHDDAGSKDTYIVMKYVAEASYAKSQDDLDGYLDWSAKYEKFQKDNDELEAWSYGATVGNLMYSHKGKLTASQRDRVQKLIDKGLAMDPKHTSLLVCQAQVFEGAGKKSEAIEIYKKVIEVAKGTRSENYYKEQMEKEIFRLNNRGAMEFPELKFNRIKGAPALSKPFLVMGETAPITTDKHGLCAPALWDWDGDGKRDLLVGEFETNSSDFPMGKDGSTIRVYLNVGSDSAPEFTDEFFYAEDAEGTVMEVPQWCCIGFTPQFVDLNNDGHKDIITGQYHPGEVTWFRGTADGKFLPGIKLEQEGNPASNGQSFRDPSMTDDNPGSFGYWVYSSANMGDFDGDGDLDLITGGSSLRMSENIGTKENPKFGKRELLLTVKGEPLKVYELTTEDLVRIKSYGGEVPASGTGKISPTVCDWNNDGVLDLLVTNGYRNSGLNAVDFFEGVKTKKGHRFKERVSLFDAQDGSKAFPGSGQRVYVDDWNKDGVNDLIVGASIVTVDGMFHGKMSWEYEDDLELPSAGKDYGRYPDQFDLPTMEEFLNGPMGDFLKDKSEEEQKKFYEQQMNYKKESIQKMENNGVSDAVNMLHRGHVYVFLGKVKA